MTNVSLLSKDTLYIDEAYKKGNKKFLSYYNILKTIKKVSFIIIYNKIILIKVSILYIFFNYIFKK